MSDQFENAEDYLNSLNPNTAQLNNEDKDLSPEQLAAKKVWMEASHQRKVIADAIKAGTLACLPGADGYADTAPARNILNPTDKSYHGVNLLFLKDHQKQNGYHTAEYITAYQVDKARQDNSALFIMKGEHGVSLHINEKNNETGVWEEKHIRLFNVAQVSKPALIKKWAEQKLQEKEQEKLEFEVMQHGANWKPEEKKPREPGPEIVCSSTEPEKYLGQYFAAVSIVSKFKASPEQAKEFSEKMIALMYEKMEPRVKDGVTIPPPVNKETGEPITNPFKLAKISNAANKECKEFISNLGKEIWKQNHPEQKHEQTQTQGRGR
jgi:hypothetical protein